MRSLLVLAVAAWVQAIPRAVPVEPVAAILDQFQSHSIVALGEVHGDLNSLKLRLALIRDPRFAQTVNDIVVEAGNARYLDVIDRYVRGDSVPAGIVREAVRNTGHKVFSIASLTPGAVALGQADVYSWPLPSLAVIRGTGLGATELAPWHPLPLDKQIDAVLVDTLAPSRVPREFCDDPDYMTMRLFRMDLRGQGDQLRRHCGIGQ
jgi:hypothetical protein